MSGLSAFLILFSLVTFVVGQLFLKRGMEASACGWRTRRFIFSFGTGIVSMTISFFLTVGLLRHLDLSYLYPFQGLTVIIITLLAGFSLRETLTMQLTIGSLLITAGVVLVSLS